MESHKRSIVKALSWRVVATVVTFLVAWLLTGTVDVAMKIGILDTTIKLGAITSTNAWIKLDFGKLKTPEYQI